MKIFFPQKRQITLLTILLTIFFCLPVKGKTGTSIPINGLLEENTEVIEAEIYSAFNSLNGAYEMINQSDSITEEQLTNYFPDVKIETKKEPFIWVNLNSGNKVWILPSFYWGCFFGSVGVLVAGIVSKWKDKYITDSLAGMLVNCNVIADIVVITYIGIITYGITYDLLYGFLMFLQENPPDFSGCSNVW